MKRPTPTFGKGAPPPDLFNTESDKHSQMETVSLIREALWNEAKWSGTAFPLFPNNSSPPFLAFLFEHGESAGRIFSFWQTELGSNDVDERLRVTIVRGISNENPHYYRALIGTNPLSALSKPDIKYAAIIFRINTMEASSSGNLNGFLNSYKICGRYFLAHAVLQKGSSTPVLIQKNAIGKSELHVREAWEIGRHDVDSVGIMVDDDPIIPREHQEDAPVLDLLRSKRERTK